MVRYATRVTIALFLTLAGCRPAPVPPPPAVAGSGTLRIAVDGFRRDAGRALVSLFAAADGFPDATEGVLTQAVPVAGGRAQAVFPDLPWGEYAVSVLHDEDGDGRMDRTWLGIPEEGHGASNNPPSRFGPPDFEEARFVFLAPERTLPIHLRYVQAGPGKKKD